MKVKAAPEPSVIIWRNLRITPRNRVCRSIITYLVSLITLGLSVIALVSIKYYQDKYSSEINYNTCASLSVTLQNAYEDSLKPPD